MFCLTNLGVGGSNPNTDFLLRSFFITCFVTHSLRQTTFLNNFRPLIYFMGKYKLWSWLKLLQQYSKSLFVWGKEKKRVKKEEEEE